jgi:hypothetical protein
MASYDNIERQEEKLFGAPNPNQPQGQYTPGGTWQEYSGAFGGGQRGNIFDSAQTRGNIPTYTPTAPTVQPTYLGGAEDLANLYRGQGDIYGLAATNAAGRAIQPIDYGNAYEPLQASLAGNDVLSRQAAGNINLGYDYIRGAEPNINLGLREGANYLQDANLATGQSLGQVQDWTTKFNTDLRQSNKFLNTYNPQITNALDASVMQRQQTNNMKQLGKKDRAYAMDLMDLATGGDYTRGLEAYGAGQEQLGTLQAAQEGKVPSVAQLQLQQGVDAAARAQLAASLSGGFNPAAQAQAAQQAGALQAQGNQASAQLRAQEIATARDQMNAMLTNQQQMTGMLAGMTQAQQNYLLGQQEADAARQQLSLQQEQMMQQEAAARQAQMQARVAAEQQSAQLRLGQQQNILAGGELAQSMGKLGTGYGTDVAGTYSDLAKMGSQYGVNSASAITDLMQQQGKLGLSAAELYAGGAEAQAKNSIQQQQLNDEQQRQLLKMQQQSYGMMLDPLQAQLQADMATQQLQQQGALSTQQTAAGLYSDIANINAQIAMGNTDARNMRQMNWMSSVLPFVGAFAAL